MLHVSLQKDQLSHLCMQVTKTLESPCSYPLTPGETTAALKDSCKELVRMRQKQRMKPTHVQERGICFLEDRGVQPCLNFRNLIKIFPL